VGITNKTAAPKWIRKFTYLHQNAGAPVYQATSSGPQSGQLGSGRVFGSTIGDGNFFFGLEAIYSSDSIATLGSRKEFSFWFPSYALLQPDSTETKGLVAGVAPKGQMRRAFLYYMSRERSHYYRMVPSYDAWYDLPGNCREDSILNRIRTFGRELAQKRGFAIKSYQCDDGWDDAGKPEVWMHFNGLTPRGFTVLKDSAADYQAGMGLWFSPMGGYSARTDRINASAPLGTETKPSSTEKGATFLSMAGPNYRRLATAAFKDKIQNHGLNLIKFDGLLMQQQDTNFFDALDGNETFADDMRTLRPDIFLNAMGGALPSPFYLLHFDGYWRDGNGDAGWLTAPWAGTNTRETWVGYRDGMAYNAVSKRSTVIPLSSISLHGITIGHSYWPADFPRDLKSVQHEVRSFFGTGTCVQELYLSPDQMNDSIYDAIAEAGKWAKSNEDIMEDSHWIGGSPWNGEVYGMAAWNQRGGTLSLRNPKTTAQSITLEIGSAFELPEGVAGVGKIYELKSPWKEDAGKPALTLVAGTPHTFDLPGLGMLQFNARPTDAVNVMPNPRPKPSGLGSETFKSLNGNLVAEFSTISSIPVRLDVYAANGKRVFTAAGNSHPGSNRLVWSGRSQGGIPLSAGSYTVTLRIGSRVPLKSTFKP
jgi:hypothetical protein